MSQKKFLLCWRDFRTSVTNFGLYNIVSRLSARWHIFTSRFVNLCRIESTNENFIRPFLVISYLVLVSNFSNISKILILLFVNILIRRTTTWYLLHNILSRVWLTIEGCWIDDRIYWTVIQRVTTIYNSLLHTYTIVHRYVFTSRCSVVASKGGPSPSSGFPNYPRLQLPASRRNSSQLNLSSS
jgi:hypothetical protein